MGSGYEYYIRLYLWRLDKQNMRVGVFNMDPNGIIFWDESEQFQNLKKYRWDNKTRWVSKNTILEYAKRPLQVKDASVTRGVDNRL